MTAYALFPLDFYRRDILVSRLGGWYVVRPTGWDRWPHRVGRRVQPQPHPSRNRFAELEAGAARREHSGELGGDAALDTGGVALRAESDLVMHRPSRPTGRFRTPSVPAASRVGPGGIAYSPSPSGADIRHNDGASGGPLLSRMLVAFGSTRPQP